MSIPSFAVRQPVLVNLVAVSMVVVGGLVLSAMHRESLPSMPTGWGSVTTVYVGASPEEIEQLVTIPVENAVGVVSVRNSHHFGAAGYYAKLAADEGLVQVDALPDAREHEHDDQPEDEEVGQHRRLRRAFAPCDVDTVGEDVELGTLTVERPPRVREATR